MYSSFYNLFILLLSTMISGSDSADDCLECAPGYYQSTPGSSTCDLCLPGTNQSAAGQVMCSECFPGHYQDKAGSLTCNTCPGTVYYIAWVLGFYLQFPPCGIGCIISMLKVLCMVNQSLSYSSMLRSDFDHWGDFKKFGMTLNTFLCSP